MPRLSLLLASLCLFSAIDSREDPDSLYDRELDKAEQKRILYHSRRLRQQKQAQCKPRPSIPYPCHPDPKNFFYPIE